MKRTQKFRTEIEIETEFPQFHKTYFEFNKVTLGNRIVMRMGLFQTNITDNQTVSSVLFDNSKLIGSNDLVFTKSLLEMLRQHKYVDNDVTLIHPENYNENGHVYFRLSLKSQTLDSKFYDDNKLIEDCYYDPFEKNLEIIKEKLKQVVILNEEKQLKMEKINKELNESNTKLKFLAMDKRTIQKEIEQLEEENNSLRKNIDKIQNYEEIHIEVDILAQSKQGVEMIEKKYVVLLGQLALQNQRKMQLDKEYSQMDTVLSKIKIIKEKIQSVKSANEELHFNTKRHEDMLPLISTYQEKIKNNDNIIKNLRENIEVVIKKNNLKEGNRAEDIDEKIKILYKDRKKLDEKKQQMNLYGELYYKNDNVIESEKQLENLPNTINEPFLRIIGNDPMMNEFLDDREQYLLQLFKNKKENLLKEHEKLSTQLDKIKEDEKYQRENTILLDPSIKIKRKELSGKVENCENREQVLLKELDTSNMFYQETIRKMKNRIILFDKLIEKEMRFGKYNYYDIN